MSSCGSPTERRLELDVALHGHAVEVRLYAEDPRTFLPQAGRVERLVLPAGVRVDAGVEQGDEIGTSYDPMIAKLIAHGSTRDEALDRLAQALRETDVGGLTTNLPFLRWLVSHPLVRAGADHDGLPHREPAAVRAAVPRAGDRVGAAPGASTSPAPRRRRRRMSTPLPAHRARRPSRRR